ncbi:hypothetical protein [Rhizobium halophilum]|uniref:hypothetical protein n=1 Tax=Rhizobium halophilum TaxID=2846852 RepID=UPI001EFEDB2F|nr:hypothetical protein [Rhizobium halophilum]MCF6368352.1 hypothetical protein [Rhizobium halophilum]
MVETLGEAYTDGWKISARCGWGRRDGLKSVRECLWKYELDMMTLVATRGRDFPLAMLSTRLRCPRCGSRRVMLAFTPPDKRNAGAIAARGSFLA